MSPDALTSTHGEFFYPQDFQAPAPEIHKTGLAPSVDLPQRGHSVYGHNRSGFIGDLAPFLIPQLLHFHVVVQF